MTARAALVFMIGAAACGSYGSGASSSSGDPPTSAGADGGVILCTDNVLYVASNGDDKNDGCDPQKPRRTITSALGVAQAKGAAGTEIRTCTETLRERVVLAYPVSIVGGFACGTWTAGAGRTTIEAPDDKEVETFIAFGASVLQTVRLEHLRIVGPSRSSGFVSTMRVKDGAAPALKDDELVGGSTAEGVAITLGVEGKSSPTIEDSLIKGGRARCTKDCTSAIATTVALDGGRPKLRRTRIEGSEADVTTDDTYVGTVTLDVFGGVQATGADAFTDLEIVHGVGRIGGTDASYGMRVIGNSEVDFVASKILAAATPSTCVSTPCTAFGIYSGNSKLHVRTSRIDVTKTEGAAGTTAVVPQGVGILAGVSATVDVASSFVRGRESALLAHQTSTMDVRASTIGGRSAVWNYAGTMNLRSSILAINDDNTSAVLSVGCQAVAKTSFESVFVVAPSPPAFAVIYEQDTTGCIVKGTPGSPEQAMAASTAATQITATNTARSPCGASANDCLLTVFAAVDDAKLKDGVTCTVAQGGIAFPEITTDLFGAPRTTPIAMGAHEYDGTCAP